MHENRNITLMGAFGRRLKAARLDAGFENAEIFAEVLGISASRYRKYERGESFPPLDILERIALRLGLDLDWVMLGTPSTRSPRLSPTKK